MGTNPQASGTTALTRRTKLVAAFAALSLGIGGAAWAQEKTPASPLRVELNRLENAGDSCRAYFLINNRQGAGWRSLKLDLFALDTDGVAAKRLAVEIGPVPEKKTLIKLFDFAGLSCPRFGRILLNDVMACEGAASDREQCLAAIETASKVDNVPFEK
ncbi:Tat pathway signal protein [Microvirga sp. GCM10011540]|uniref:Tat pathway signal protein n=1 Tax=Microvirga sp. GCM10011540 TaxID=3317338 RepID=UPI0036083E42